MSNLKPVPRRVSPVLGAAIADLKVMGLSNREIGRRLSLHPSTVALYLDPASRDRVRARKGTKTTEQHGMHPGQGRFNGA